MLPDFIAKQAEYAYYNRNDEHILRLVRKFALLNRQLTKDEQTLFSQAIVKSVRARRDCMTLLQYELEHQHHDERQTHELQHDLDTQRQLFNDLIESILNTLNVAMLPQACEPEYVVFLQKINGDFNRYLAELATGELRRTYAQNTLNAYKAACKVALVKLRVTHTLRMGLLLNFAVFFYDIMASPRRAVAILNATIKDIIDSHETPDAVGRMYVKMLQKNRDLWMEELRGTVKEFIKRKRQPLTKSLCEISSCDHEQHLSFHSHTIEQERCEETNDVVEEPTITKPKPSSDAMQVAKLKKRVSYASDVMFA